MVSIRKAKASDITMITDIYNEAIRNTVATFDTEKKTVNQIKEWFASHGPKNPIIVAQSDDAVVGWASLSQWSDRCAYSDTAEISVYVDPQYRGKGIGKKLMKNIVEDGEIAGLHVLIARITEANGISVHLHKAVGFTHIGTMHEVGSKFGKRLDVSLMEKIYPSKKE